MTPLIAKHFITDKKQVDYFKTNDVLFVKHVRNVTSNFRNIIFEKYNESPEPNNSTYLTKGNRDIVNLYISILIYFIEFMNQTDNKEEFLTLKNFKVHKTQYTEVFAQLVTINGKIYVGLQRKSYYGDQNNPRLKIGRAHV